VKTGKAVPLIPFDEAVAYAVKALAAGKAIEAQQRLAVDWLIRIACRTYEDQFDPESVETTTYMLGRRSVGQAVANLIAMPATRIPKARKATET
jgi:hypothetical protein